MQKTSTARHEVQFYEDDTFLIEGLCRRIGTSLCAGNAVVVIAKRAHRAALRQALSKLVPESPVPEDQFLEMDAEEVLERLAPGGQLQPDTFAQVVEAPIAAMCERFGHAEIFGEIVAVMCERGDHADAIRLERLWNGLLSRQPVTLLCGYRMRSFESASRAEEFSDICSAHSQITPTEAYLRLDEAGRRRLVAKLQQRAAALEEEVRHRETLATALSERERELKDFLENGAEPLSRVDANGRIVWANRAELELLGYSREEYVGGSISRFHAHPERAQELLQRLRSGSRVLDLPARLRRKDGELRDVLISATAYFGQPGTDREREFLYGQCFTRDVTAESNAQRMLHEEIRMWESLRRASDAMVGELEQDKLLQIITDTAVELAGARYGGFFRQAPGEPSKLTFTLSGADPDAFAHSAIARNEVLLHATLAGERVIRCDDLPEHPAFANQKDDLDRPPLATRSYLAVPIATRDGTVMGGLFLAHSNARAFTRRDELIASGIASHATIALDNARLFRANELARRELRQLNEHLEERIAAQIEQVRRAEVQLQRVVAGIADHAIFFIDASGNVLTWNLGAERIKGYTASEIIGSNFERFYTEEDRRAGVPKHALEMARRHGRYEMEAWRARKDGSRFWANVNINAVRDDKGEVTGFIKITRDMTERKLFEDQLRQAQKMEAIGQLTGGVAHDFNNLLTIILGNIDIVERAAGGNQKVAAAARQARQGAERAATLTR